MKDAILNESGLARLRLGHPWLFRGNLRTFPEATPGDLVAIRDGKGVAAWGFWSDSSLCLRVLTRGPQRPDLEALLADRIGRAQDIRKRFLPGDDAYRLLHGEADGLPGLVADRYGPVLCVQLLSAGWRLRRDAVVRILLERTDARTVILRNDVRHPEREGIPREISLLAGPPPPETGVEVRMGDLREIVLPTAGQKTGVYLDIRHVPSVLKPLMPGARVLDCFSFQGHFALSALLYGAASVTGIEQSENAIAVAERNRALNGLAGEVEWRCGNAFDVLRDLEREGRRYDVVIMDPPPFAPSKDRIDSARRGYKDLALRALRLLDNRGALLFLSCSHAFGRDILLDTLGEAARDAKRRIVVAGEIHQPADHPRVPDIPETDYLKGFLCAVDSN